MKFGVLFANAGPYIRPEAAVKLAQACEERGFDSLWTVEHSCVPLGYQSRYPNSADGKLGPEDAPIPDPLIWLAYVAAATERIRLATGVVILPQRHPIYVAKEVATLDVLSGGRVMLGIGLGWLAEESEALGLHFADRAARTDEACEAMRSLWAPGPSEFSGKHFSWGPLESNPKPAQSGGVPIVVGGYTRAAARRAARFGDGFFPLLLPGPGLAELRKTLAEECARIGRDPGEIEITTELVPQRSRDDVLRLRDQGVGRVLITPPGRNPEKLAERLDVFANEVMARC